MLSFFSRVQLFATLWTVACQAPLSMGFSRQEYWSGLPWPPQGDLPHPGIKPVCLMSPALGGGFFITWATWEALLEHWSGLPFLSPGDLPHPGIKPVSLPSPALASRFLTTSITWEDFTIKTWISRMGFKAVWIFSNGDKIVGMGNT